MRASSPSPIRARAHDVRYALMALMENRRTIVAGNTHPLTVGISQNSNRAGGGGGAVSPSGQWRLNEKRRAQPSWLERENGAARTNLLAYRRSTYRQSAARDARWTGRYAPSRHEIVNEQERKHCRHAALHAESDRRGAKEGRREGGERREITRGRRGGGLIEQREHAHNGPTARRATVPTPDSADGRRRRPTARTRSVPGPARSGRQPGRDTETAESRSAGAHPKSTPRAGVGGPQPRYRQTLQGGLRTRWRWVQSGQAIRTGSAGRTGRTQRGQAERAKRSRSAQRSAEQREQHGRRPAPWVVCRVGRPAYRRAACPSHSPPPRLVDDTQTNDSGRPPRLPAPPTPAPSRRAPRHARRSALQERAGCAELRTTANNDVHAELPRYDEGVQRNAR